jgi:hypothetical protein
MLLTLTLASAAPVDPRYWLTGAVVGAVGPAEHTSVGGGAMGGFGLAFTRDPRRSLGLEVHSRELFLTEESRSVASIGFRARYPCGTGPFAALGFAHNHEQAWQRAQDHLLATTLATDPQITHRTGIELGVGLDLPPTAPEAEFASRIRFRLAIAEVILPATEGPLAYTFVEVGLRLGVGKMAGP